MRWASLLSGSRYFEDRWVYVHPASHREAARSKDEAGRFPVAFFILFYHFIVHQVEPMMDFTCFTLKAGGKGDAAQGR